MPTPLLDQRQFPFFDKIRSEPIGIAVARLHRSAKKHPSAQNFLASGNLLNIAIFRRDIPILQATILVLASFFVVLNLCVDILQAAIDPRLRR